MSGYRLGIDISGTFTDFSLLEEATGALTVFKTPSVPARPEQAIFNGLRILFDEHGIDPAHIGYFVHGTTLAVNTIIQRRGDRMALLVTRGFRDILSIGRHRIPDVFNFFTELPIPLVPRSPRVPQLRHDLHPLVSHLVSEIVLVMSIETEILCGAILMRANDIQPDAAMRQLIQCSPQTGGEIRWPEGGRNGSDDAKPLGHVTEQRNQRQRVALRHRNSIA
jgi:hypothetical protein